jgi:DNA-binding PadR family transcriptional regulator
VSKKDLQVLRRPNDPNLLLLTSLASGPKHGYALLKDVEEFAGVTLSPGTLYGAITRLEELGLIEPLEEVDRRRPYRITARGAQVLREVTSEMRRLADVGVTRLRLATGGAS